MRPIRTVMITAVALSLAACGDTGNPVAPDIVANGATGAASAATVETRTHIDGTVHDEAEGSVFDDNFVQYAAMVNEASIRLGDIANQRGDTAEVKWHGQQMSQDHRVAQEALGERLLGHAPSGVTLNADYQRLVTDLAQLSGSVLDSAFVPQMLDHHHAVISRFEQAANRADSDEVRDYAQAFLPTLMRHLRNAERLATMVP